MELNLEKKSAQQEQPQEEKKAEIDKHGRAYGTGRRKVASARVWVKPGKGKFTVNGRDIKDYFPRPSHQMIINQPLAATSNSERFDVICTVTGGGPSGQAGAVRHGLSRALDNYDPTQHKTLRRGGYLTRDSRVVERKKYGRRKARRRFQFSKR